MAQAPSSSSSTSKTATPSLSPEAQDIVDQLETSARVFVSKADLAEDDEEDLKAAGYAVDEDVVREGVFIRRLSDTEKADAEFAKAQAAAAAQSAPAAPTTSTTSSTSTSSSA